VHWSGGRLAIALLVGLVITQPAWAQEAAPDTSPAIALGAPAEETREAPATSLATYIVPAADIVAFDFLLNRYGWHFVDHVTYDSNAASVRRNLKGPWVLDNDPFATNQFLHPYQGAMYFGFARSAGLGFWPSFGYAFGGSLLWEIAGETTPPSKNDQIASGVGGAFLGEPLFRIANLILEQSNGAPGFWSELSAALVSPATGFNRVVYGSRFKNVFPGNDPAFSARAQFGVMGTASTLKADTQSLVRNEGVVDLAVEYGLPGNSEYVHRRPFDYFNFQFTGSSANGIEGIFSRGLLAGKDYGEQPDAYRGVWGLFGSYDYVAPQLFRVSSTALSFGNTSQRPLFQSSALQSTLLAGVGYGAGGTINGAGERDYHYGLTPQILTAMRLVVSNRAALELTLRDYFISSVASTEHRGSENISRVEGLLMVRFLDAHAASIRYLWSRRAASYPDLGNRVQAHGSIGLFYTYLGGATRFGVVKTQKG
jgi:hypothetical protein